MKVDLKKLLTELVSKSAITAYGSASDKALTTSAAVIPLTTYDESVGKVGSDITIVNGGLRCEKTGFVLISARGYFTTGFTANDLVHLVIRWQEVIDIVNCPFRIPSTYSCFSIAPQLYRVSAGSTLHLYAYNQTAARGNISNGKLTELTVVYI